MREIEVKSAEDWERVRGLWERAGGGSGLFADTAEGSAGGGSGGLVRESAETG